jgi:hypothetical protein
VVSIAQKRRDSQVPKDAFSARGVLGMLQWGRLWEVAANFMLAKAKFAVACQAIRRKF